jgi:hypothetical protein
VKVISTTARTNALGMLLWKECTCMISSRRA